jgi:hypothetical protein
MVNAIQRIEQGDGARAQDIGPLFAIHVAHPVAIRKFPPI